MTTPNLVQGQLSLGSYVKLSVIAAIGILPVLAVICGIYFVVALIHVGAPTDPPGLALALWPLLLFKVVAEAVTIVLSGFFMGLFSYPFYAWLCRRWGGVILKGKFEVML